MNNHNDTNLVVLRLFSRSSPWDLFCPSQHPAQDRITAPVFEAWRANLWPKQQATWSYLGLGQPNPMVLPRHANFSKIVVVFFSMFAEASRKFRGSVTSIWSTHTPFPGLRNQRFGSLVGNTEVMVVWESGLPDRSLVGDVIGVVR